MPQINHSIKSVTKAFAKRFLDREDGYITIESMLILPMLFWSMFASYTYYDSYRQSARNIKGAYAIADVLSREDDEVNAAYINTLYDLLETMVYTRSPVSMRVTYLTYDGENTVHEVLWSCVRGNELPKWSNANIDEIKHRIPVMPDNGYMILVETRNTYRAPFGAMFDLGFDDFQMNNLVFTHPRIFDNIVSSDPSCVVA